MKRLYRIAIIGLISGLFSLAGTAFGNEPRIDLSGGIAWDRMELNARAALNLAQAEIRLPTGRSQAEEMINEEFPALIQPSLLAIPVDSSSTMKDLIDRGEFTLHSIGSLALSAKRQSPALSQDLSFLSASYSVDLTMIASALIQHRRSAEVPRPVQAGPDGSYTGIIIFADRELPVHGRNISAAVQPCLFPKIWDSGMNLIYQRNMTDPQRARTSGMVRYASAAKVFMPAPSGLDSELEKLVGPNPLRILARGVYGARPTDPIIDRADALLITASEANRRLLNEGRVVLVLSESALNSPLISGEY
jgi:hypothetical protein